MYQLKGERLSPFVKGTPQGVLRQQLPPVYRDCGAVYVTWHDVLLKKKSIFGDNYRSYYIDPEHAIDIDTSFDLKLAEALLREKK